jgi:uncharacterized protein (DUF488 family)
MPDTPIYTIGYGARDIDAFIATLQANAIQYLIDVRSRPYSRYKPDFSKEALAAHLEKAGIRYVFMGDTLGGQPPDDSCYTDGKVDYDKVATRDFFMRGVERLHEAYRQQLAVALMCSEGKPEQCHRSKLIAPNLNERQIVVMHIDENDQLISQDDVGLRLQKGQPSLFGDEFQQLTSRKRYQVQDDD